MPSGLGAWCTVESRREGEASEATREGPDAHIVDAQSAIA